MKIEVLQVMYIIQKAWKKSLIISDMNVFLSGPKADDIEDNPDRVLSFDAFATGLGDVM